jgi:16S rRNA (adenine1518-N6/adenine1519-N6)-dimethyltransferase
MTSYSPKKSLGQNFLINQGACKSIADTVTRPNSIVLEIGPGRGHLTKALLQNINVVKIIAVEKDIAMYEHMMDYVESNNLQDRLVILQEDALRLNYQELRSSLFNNEKITVVANLPYNVGTNIVMQMVENIDYFYKIVVMLQKEVVDRFTAKPSTKDYGRLSIMTQIRCSVKKILTISAGSFFPVPKVTSAVMELNPLELQPNNLQTQLLSDICTFAFAARRKTMLNGLKTKIDDELYNFIAANIDNKARIEDFTPQYLIALVDKYLANKR